MAQPKLAVFYLTGSGEKPEKTDVRSQSVRRDISRSTEAGGWPITGRLASEIKLSLAIVPHQ